MRPAPAGIALRHRLALGFLIASRAPVWVSVALFIAAELIVGLIIRDGLILNVIMLLWLLEAIRQWQSAG